MVKKFAENKKIKNKKRWEQDKKKILKYISKVEIFKNNFPNIKFDLELYYILKPILKVINNNIWLSY